MSQLNVLRFAWALFVGVMVLTAVPGCKNDKPDTQGRIDGIEDVTMYSPSQISLLTRQGDKVILVNMKSVGKVEILTDVKPDQTPWVEFVQVGDTNEYKSATFHVRQLKDVLRHDPIPPAVPTKNDPPKPPEEPKK